MLTSPDERVLLLAERWLKLLSYQGRAQDTLTACRRALRHYFAFCRHRTELNLKRPGLKTWLLISALSCTVNTLPRSGTSGILCAGRTWFPASSGCRVFLMIRSGRPFWSMQPAPSNATG